MSAHNLSEILDLLLSGLVGFTFGLLSAWVNYRLAKKRDDLAWERDLQRVRQELDRQRERMKSQEHAQQQAEIRLNLLSQNLVDYAALLRQTDELIRKLKHPGNPHPKESSMAHNTEFQRRIDLLEKSTHDLIDIRASIVRLLSEIHGMLAQLDLVVPGMDLDGQGETLQQHLAAALDLSARLLHDV